LGGKLETEPHSYRYFFETQGHARSSRVGRLDGFHVSRRVIAIAEHSLRRGFCRQAIPRVVGIRRGPARVRHRGSLARRRVRETFGRRADVIGNEIRIGRLREQAIQRVISIRRGAAVEICPRERNESLYVSAAIPEARCEKRTIGRTDRF
jgi:hypothetical protein